jgi:hypothetical protein
VVLAELVALPALLRAVARRAPPVEAPAQGEQRAAVPQDGLQAAAAVAAARVCSGERAGGSREPAAALAGFRG